LYSNLYCCITIQSRCKIISHQAVTIHWSFNAEISSVNSSDNTLRNHFDFKDYEGNIQSTADLKGKVVFINFGHHGVHPVLPNFP
jgi:hypothetical protein